MRWAKEEARLETLKYKKEQQTKAVPITFHSNQKLDYGQQVLYRGVIVLITILRLNRRMVIRSTKKARNIAQILSFKWECLWMETAFLLLFHYFQEIQMNKLL